MNNKAERKIWGSYQLRSACSKNFKGGAAFDSVASIHLAIALECGTRIFGKKKACQVVLLREFHAKDEFESIFVKIKIDRYRF